MSDEPLSEIDTDVIRKRYHDGVVFPHLHDGPQVPSSAMSISFNDLLLCCDEIDSLRARVAHLEAIERVAREWEEIEGSSVYAAQRRGEKLSALRALLSARPGGEAEAGK